MGRVRAAAAAAASSIGGEEAYALLRQLLEKDPDWQVKSTCQGFITSWENAIQRRAEFDEVDEWLAANTAEYNENKKQA